MSSTVLTYQNSIAQTATSAGTLDGAISLLAPLQFNPQSRRYFRLLKVQFSKYLANLHNITGGENNSLFRISNDAGATWTIVQPIDGQYRAFDIELIANKVASDLGWWADITQPGFKIRSNYSDQRTYTILDSTKLVAGQLGIDFSVSLIWKFLGYTNILARTFVTDGEYDSPSPGLIDWFGSTISLSFRGLGPLSLKNGQQSFEVCAVPLAIAYGSNDIIYPLAGIPSPKIPLPQVPPIVKDIQISLSGSRTDTHGNPVSAYFIPGSEINVQFELAW